MRVLVVPGEAAELDAVEAWAERRRASGELRNFRAVSHARAPYSLRASEWDLVLYDLASGEDDALELLREARTAADAVPFVLIEPVSGAAQRDALHAQGGTFFVPRHELGGERIARAVAEAFGLGTPRVEAPRVRAEARIDSHGARARNADLVPAMLFRTDARGAFTHFSRAWTRFTGRDEAHDRGA